jgi:hypothetical protein
VRKYGLDNEGIVELMAVVDLFSGYNKLMDDLHVEPDENPGTGEAQPQRRRARRPPEVAEAPK